MKHYTLAFIFDESYERVVLINKKSNKFEHKGLWNGLGGKFEESDKDLYDSVERECNEESGLAVNNLEKYATLSFNEMQIHVFRGTGIFPPNYKYETDEGIVASKYIEEIDNFPCVENISWLVFLAIDFDKDRKFVEVVYEQ